MKIKNIPSKRFILLGILVVLLTIYITMPSKNIFEITGWSTAPQEYTKIMIRESGMDNGGRVLTSVYETQDNDLIRRILDYLNTYELKRWYKKKLYRLDSNEKFYDIKLDNEKFEYKSIRLTNEYVQITDKNDNKNYKVKNKEEDKKNYFEDLLQQMTIRE